jgi:hypothetical protein
MQAMRFFSAEFANYETIETPRASDIPQLAALTRRLSTAPSESLLLPQTESAWRALIAAEDMACARTRDGRIVGCYLTNHFIQLCEPGDLPALRGAHGVLCNRFKLRNEIVSFGAQALIDISWQNTDLRPHLLRALLRHVGLRYRFLFTAVKKDDAPEMQVLPIEGWRCFHEEDDTCYMMLDVARALRLLASRLVLRIPQRPDGPSAAVTPR